MGAYRPLFSLAVEHEFFPERICLGLDFVPTAASATLLQKTGLLTRQNANGFQVFFDSDQAEALDLYAGNPDEPFDFAYRVYSKDLLFKNYTEAGTYKEDALLYFDSEKALPDGPDRFRLHEAAAVSEADLLSFDAPLLNAMLSKKDRLVRPAFVVKIALSSRRDRSSDYTLKFRSRETFWKYYLLGNRARKEAYITDLGNKTQFEFTGSEALNDQKIALTFRSKNPIPLREKLDCRFQLRERGPGNGKVLINRLPVAAATQISKETINGIEAVISEIYVNC